MFETKQRRLKNVVDHFNFRSGYTGERMGCGRKPSRLASWREGPMQTVVLELQHLLAIMVTSILQIQVETQGYISDSHTQ